MNVLGIIAEYNPFHKGHAYQIETLKKETDAPYAIIAMGGNFMQRGAPALMEKYSRAAMALSCGADLVLELPALYACASAESFAYGGVALLEGTGVVTHLGFGTETSHFRLLQETASLLARQPLPFRQALKQGLKQGLSFPAARSLAVKACLGREENQPTGKPQKAGPCPTGAGSRPSCGSPSQKPPSGQGENCHGTELGYILASPNNILAVEYLKALSHCHSGIIPAPLPRRGQPYHDASAGQEFSSASAIRASIQKPGSCLVPPAYANSQNPGSCLVPSACPNSQGPDSCPVPPAYPNSQELDSCPTSAKGSSSNLDIPERSMPAASFGILRDYPHPFLWEDDFSTLLHYKLLTESQGQLSRYADSSPDLARRMKKEAKAFLSWSSFCQHLKTKNITYARLSRVCLHTVLNINKDDCQPLPEPSYLRVLGFRKQAAPLLAAIKAHGSLPILTNPAAAPKLLPVPAQRLLSHDLAASSLYRIGLAAKGDNSLKNDYQHPIICL